jgi:hypothetical protein
MKYRQCIHRAQCVKQEEHELMLSIMAHMEAYQRSAQALLPPKLLEQVGVMS